MARREEGAYPQRSVTDEQRSHPALSTKTLRATVLFEWGVVGSAITDRCGSAQASPPSPIQKSLVAVPFLLFGQALSNSAKQKTRIDRVDAGRKRLTQAIPGSNSSGLCGGAKRTPRAGEWVSEREWHRSDADRAKRARIRPRRTYHSRSCSGRSDWRS